MKTLQVNLVNAKQEILLFVACNWLKIYRLGIYKAK